MPDGMPRGEPAKQEELLDYRNPSLSVDERVADLLSRMTLEEKTAQMLCIWRQKGSALFDENGKLDVSRLEQHFKHGVGQIARISDTLKGLTARGMVDLANSLQRYFVEETRLGIPAIFHEECLHGLAANEATSYPVPIGLASTFDPALVQEIYDTVARETRSRGAHQALTPVVDVARDPRWGRVEETFGEDPYLVAQMGIAAVRGFQGDGRFTDRKHVLATLKHFAAHGAPESGTNCGPANVSERVLRDTFLSPFREVLRKADAASVMASYNEIDGVPSHANRWLLRDVLHDEWGFKGFVVSDYFAITELHRRPDTQSHALAASKEQAALLAARAGVNIELPDPDCYPALPHLVQEGLLEESEIDDLVFPLLKYKFLLGLFDDPYIHPEELRAAPAAEKKDGLALRAARETIILLKNDAGTLPLDVNKLRTIAVIGPNADRRLLGGYSGKPPHFTSLVQGIEEKVANRAKVLYSEGCKITVGGSWEEDGVVLSDPDEDRKAIALAVQTARKSDCVILALGGNEQTSREAWGRNHLGDRPTIDLVGMQNDLVEAILATGKPVIVVLFNGRPNSITYIQDHVPAILECWYLGQESGHAVADVLFGDYNPGGKLPMSFPRSAGHIPCYYNCKPSARRGYLFGDATPLYPFGFGLSYTRFQLGLPRLGKPTIRTDESTTVSVDVKNTGTRAGDEVIQLYIRDLVSSVTRPVKELKGFKRVHLEPNASATVALTVGPEQLSFTNIDKEEVVEPGEFALMVGCSSRDEDLVTIPLHVV